MPHILAANFAAAQTPFESAGLKFLFASIGKEGVAGVQAQNRNFLLHFSPRNDATILKVDKATRPPFLESVKLALVEFANASGATIIRKNFGEIKSVVFSDLFYEPNEFIAKFDRGKKLWIEAGFGSGRHILQNAKRFSDKLHLGAEIHRPSAMRLLRRAEEQGVGNVAALLCDAKTLLAALPSACAERVFAHFPIPWDKSPDRRIFSEPFVKEALRVLEKNGVLHLRTDSQSYFNRALEIAKKFENAAIETKTNEEAITRSKYEDRWRRLNKTIFDLFLTNLRDQTQRSISYNFDFPNAIKPKGEIARGLIANSEKFLLKADRRWQLANEGYLVRLIMGDRLALQTAYLLAQNDRVAYFPSEPIHSPSNFLAHNALIETLYG
ncbi:MAG: tRNA (guanosine(46)-N7)-methyltransferase TrmB [Helicobacteraceae bacterium]|jgi:tRNA (guanine-N7-)-methyltransferase|nr:tRNA (guanosine(46)-N7)-methyltransferase TrmB [Helicobacteraceae bacterium]